MENIDDFMQRKFESDNPAERFPFREEFWEQAQALLEADEQRRRKRRRFLFWWFFAGLLTGAASLWLWHTGKQESLAGSIHSNEQKRTPESTQPAAPAAPDADAPYNPPGTTETARISSKNTSEPIDNQMNGLGERSAEISQTKTKKQGAQTSADTERNSKTTPKNTVPTSKQGLRASENPLLPKAKNPTNPDAITAKQNTTKLPATSKESNPSGVSSGAEASAPTPAASDAQSPDPDNRNYSLEILEALELPFPPAQRREVKLLLKQAPTKAVARIKPVADKRLHWIAGAAISRWNAGTGYTAGISGTYRLAGRWSLLAGVNWRYMPLAPAPTVPDSSLNVVVQYRYSFGFERTEWKRESQALHYLELPLALHWQRGRLGLETGIAPGLLILAQTKVTQTQESSLSGSQLLDEKTVRGDRSTFRPAYFSTFALAEYRVLSGLSLTLRGNYRPGTILKPLESTVPDANFWNLDMGLRWRF